MTSATDRFYKITEDGVCIGCGLCQSIAGSQSVTMQRAKSGELRPRVHTPLPEAVVDTIYATCPGVRAEAVPPETLAAARQHDAVWGGYNHMVTAWAGDPEVRHAGSTGGVLTALGQFLLQQHRVAFVLHVRPSVAEPTFGESVLSETPDDVLAGVGSRYGPTAALVGVEDALARNEPFAVMAKPCDLNALRNLARVDERVNALVRYWLTPVCGGFFPDASMARFLSDQSVDRQDVVRFRYRGLGCPGPTTATLTNGETRDWHYLDFWGDDESQWQLPFRCKVCPDGIGEGADIAVADSWDGGSPDREASKTDLGTNALVVRTEVGDELLESAVRAGALVCESSLTVEDLNRYQPHQRNKKYSVGARHRAMRDAGLLYPEPVGLRIDALSSEMTEAFNEAQHAGTLDRVARGKVREKIDFDPE